MKVHWALVLGALLPLFIIACTDPAPRPSALESDPFREAPLHVSYDVTVHFNDSTHRRATLLAGVARLFEDRRETTLGGGVKVVFYQRGSGHQAAVLTSDSAIIDDRTKNMVAIGNVLVISDSSRTSLATPRLNWDQTAERITTSESIRIVSPMEVIEGVGLVSDQYLSTYRIFKVKGIHRP